MDIIYCGGDELDIRSVLDAADGKRKVELSAAAFQNISRGELNLNSLVESSQTIYGVNTGFGALASKKISNEQLSELQQKILQSHSVGVGESVSPRIAKLMLITKLHALSKGYSGVQLTTLQRILWHIHQDIIPVVPQQGSVGASGDLAPLSHLFLPLIGLGFCHYKGSVLPTREIFLKEGLSPIALGPKEGLALINGTQFMLSYAMQAVERFFYCLEAADIIGAMSLEALTGTQSPFDSRLHALRPFKGAQLVAQRLRLLLRDSSIMESHIECGRVQDPYSLRCMPQVHGASRNAWLHLKEMTTTELNAVTDNPLIISDHEAISGGNFHGQPIAMPMDYACFAASELGNISDRRCYLLLEGKWGLPLLLMKDVGLNSGFMIPQYTTAALVSENKTLCYPASADSIPTSLGQEDHVSMGSISGRKLNKVLDNLENILAIELLSACQAIEFRRPLTSSDLLEAAHQYVRKSVSFADEDRVFADDIQVVGIMLKDFSFVNKVKAEALKKNIFFAQGFEEFSY